MKRIILMAYLISLVICLQACQKKELLVYEGMQYKDFLEIIKDEEILLINNYAFYEEKNSNLIIKFTPDCSIIDTISRYPKSKINKDNIEELRIGMSIYEVVEKIGLPKNCVSSGLIILNFKIRNNQYLFINFDSETWEVMSIK